MPTEIPIATPLTGRDLGVLVLDEELLQAAGFPPSHIPINSREAKVQYALERMGTTILAGAMETTFAARYKMIGGAYFDRVALLMGIRRPQDQTPSVRAPHRRGEEQWGLAFPIGKYEDKEVAAAHGSSAVAIRGRSCASSSSARCCGRTSCSCCRPTRAPPASAWARSWSAGACGPCAAATGARPTWVTIPRRERG